MSLKIVELSDRHDEVVLWDRYVLDRAVASGYHLSGWRAVVERAFGHKSIYLMAQDVQGEVRGVLPLVLLSSVVFGRFLVSMPFLNYGGIVADDESARTLLMEAAVAAAKRVQAEHIELRQSQSIETAWTCKEQKVSMRLDLSGRFQDLWNSFPSKLRSQVRRAQKENMTMRIGGSELLNEFYEVFSRNMRDLGTPVYAKSFFKTILAIFPKETKICVVTWDGKVLAGSFLYCFREMMEIPWASADRRYDRLAANMFLYSSVLEYACQQGCKVFDFGRSSKDSGTYRFKQQWGARPTQLYWYYWLKRSGALPELNPDNPRYQLAISLWQKLPLAVTTRVGPHIVKFLP